MNTINIDLMMSLPEIIVLCMAMFVLILDLFLNDKHRMAVFSLTQATLIGAAYYIYQSSTSAVEYGYTGLFVDDPLSDTLKIFTLLGAAVMLVYTRPYLLARSLLTGEYYALVLFAILGMMILISGQSLLTIYIGLELLSLCLYALVAMDRDNAQATEAAMKYFILGVLASGLLLYGMSMIYGTTGHLNLTEIAQAFSNADTDNPVLALGLVFMVAGLAFKLGAAPFHMWAPDIYHGSSTAITIFIGSVSKLAGFAIAIRLLVTGLEPLATDWQDMLIIMAILSIVIGNITAIAQTNIKRMLAYSAIAHIGFMLYGLMSVSSNGYASSMFYMLSYVLMTLAAFGIILWLSKKGFEVENLDDFKGLNQHSPWAAFMMLITMFSMAGVPPTLGFYAKFTVLQAALQAGLAWQVTFAVLMAVVGAYYYLRVIKVMYFDAATDGAFIDTRTPSNVLISVNVFALLLIGLMPQWLLDICAKAMFIRQ